MVYVENTETSSLTHELYPVLSTVSSSHTGNEVSEEISPVVSSFKYVRYHSYGRLLGRVELLLALE